VEQIREGVLRGLAPLLGLSAAQEIVDGWTVGQAVDEMDRNGIATAVPCIGPSGALADAALAHRLFREWNDDAADLGRDYPGRFGLFAAIPLTDVDASLLEIEYAFEVLKVDGVGVVTSYGNHWLGDEPFIPVFEELNRRKAVVFVHPTVAACSCMMPTVPPFYVEVPTDTTRAITNLVLTGSVARFPDIRFIFCHGGGTLTAISGRIASLVERRPDLALVAPRGFLAELANFHYEVAQAADPVVMSALMKMVPTTQILFGTDTPFVPAPATVTGLHQLNLAVADLQSIERGNAEVLLPRWRP
jgi:predicted TIM-barrel fold metal-dependent hydrolase